MEAQTFTLIIISETVLPLNQRLIDHKKFSLTFNFKTFLNAGITWNGIKLLA